MIGVADLQHVVVQLLERLLACGRRHPVERLDVRLVRLQQIRDQKLRLRFGLRREVFGNIELAERLTHSIVEQLHAACSAIELLRFALKDCAIEGKIRVIEFLRQIRRKAVQIANRQIIAPDGQWRLGENLCERWESGFLRHDQCAVSAIFEFFADGCT